MRSTKKTKYVAPKYQATYVIKSDSDGPFVTVAGRVYRPRFPRPYRAHYRDGTSLKVGTRVPASVTKGNPILSIGGGGSSESWMSEEVNGFLR